MTDEPQISTEAPNVEQVTPATTVEPTAEPKPAKKTTKKASKAKQPEPDIEPAEITIEQTSELDDLKKELDELRAKERTLTEEKTTLEATITELKEEIKITPQKIGRAIKEMGIEPLSVSRENPQAMNIERYMSMSDTDRRAWQRSHKTEYIKMLHNSKFN